MPEKKKRKVKICEEEFWPVYLIFDLKEAELCDIVELPESLLKEYKEAMEKFLTVQKKLRKIIQELDERWKE